MSETLNDRIANKHIQACCTSEVRVLLADCQTRIETIERAYTALDNASEEAIRKLEAELQAAKDRIAELHSSLKLARDYTAHPDNESTTGDWDRYRRDMAEIDARLANQPVDSYLEIGLRSQIEICNNLRTHNATLEAKLKARDEAQKDLVDTKIKLNRAEALLKLLHYWAPDGKAGGKIAEYFREKGV